MTDLKDYMINMPSEMQKIKIEMNKCFDVYKILEDFNWRFTTEEMTRRWNIFAGPRDVMQLVELREKELDKLK